VYLYRAIDQYGQVIDVLVSENRDLAATRRFFIRALDHDRCPSEVRLFAVLSGLLSVRSCMRVLGR
jgi:transposase-like protein